MDRGNGFQVAEEKRTQADEQAREIVERYIHHDNPMDASMQWLVREVFDDFHGYFQQPNALEYKDPLSGREWITSPPLEVMVGAKPATLVVAMEKGEGVNSPVRFFAERCDGQVIGAMQISDHAFELGPQSLGYPFIEISGVRNSQDLDFETVTANELHDFTDALTKWFISHPKENIVQKSSKLALEKTKNTVESSVNGFADAAKFIAMSFVHVAQGIGHGIAAVVTAPFKGLKKLGDVHLWESVYDRRNFVTVRGAAVGVGASCAVLFGGFKAYDHFDETTAEYDAMGQHLPVASAAPFDDSYHEVPILTAAQTNAIGNAPDIEWLDENGMTKGRAETTFEDDVVDPEFAVDHVREVPIPEDGQCVTVQTFNIPKGTVRMVATPNAPKLIVSLQRGTGNIEETQAGYYEKAKRKSDTSKAAELTQASVCNPSEIRAVDFGPPDGSSLMIEFTRLGGPGS